MLCTNVTKKKMVALMDVYKLKLDHEIVCVKTLVSASCGLKNSACFKKNYIIRLLSNKRKNESFNLVMLSQRERPQNSM